MGTFLSGLSTHRRELSGKLDLDALALSGLRPGKRQHGELLWRDGTSKRRRARTNPDRNRLGLEAEWGFL